MDRVPQRANNWPPAWLADANEAAAEREAIIWADAQPEEAAAALAAFGEIND